MFGRHSGVRWIAFLVVPAAGVTLSALALAGGGFSASLVDTADLAASITGPTSVPANTDATYQLNVRNRGPDTAMGVSISAQFQAGANVALKSLTALDGGCVTELQLPLTIGRCTFSSIPIGGSATATLTVTVIGGGIGLVGFDVSGASSDPDVSNNSATLTVNLPVQTPSVPCRVCYAPNLTSSELPIGYVGEPYRERLQIWGSFPPFSTRLESAGTTTPDFNVTGDGWVMGTPTKPGSFSLAVTLVDSAPFPLISSNRGVVHLVVDERPPLTLSQRLPHLTAGVTMDIALVQGGTPPYGIRAARASLPRGWRLGEGARLTGTPTISGPYRVRLFATDALRRETSAVVFGIVSARPGFHTRPNPLSTPGALVTAVRQSTLGRTVCSRAWLDTHDLAPAAPARRAVLLRYGLPATATGYALSHLVPASLGGAARDEWNIWPQLTAEATRMTRVESRLHARLCSGQETLATARQRFRDALTSAP